MKRELKSILTVLQGRQQKTLNYDWHYALGMLLLNRVGVPFLLSCKNTETELPKQVEKVLSDIYRQQVRRNRIMGKWIADISYELDAAEIRFALLKGSILSYCDLCGTSLYSFGERISNDIDILIAPKDIYRVDKVLCGLGFIQGEWDKKACKIIPYERREIVFRRMTRGETAPYVISTQSEEIPFIEIDMNYSLGYLPSGDSELVDKMLRECKQYTFADGDAVPSMPEETFLLHLIMHQFKEATLYWMVARHKDSQLYKYLDIYRLIDRCSIDEGKFFAIVNEFGLQNEVAYVLFLCDKLFPCPKTERLLKRFRPVEETAINKVTDTERRAEYFWTKEIFDRVGIYGSAKHLKKL